MTLPMTTFDDSSHIVKTVGGDLLRIGAGGVVSGDTDVVDPIDPEQVRRCVGWFQQAEATKDPSLNSFWLRHFVENWAGSEISHGAIIVAASTAGFPIVRDREASGSGVSIGVSTACVDEFDCGCGHFGS